MGSEMCIRDRLVRAFVIADASIEMAYWYKMMAGMVFLAFGKIYLLKKKVVSRSIFS